jgi:hypothetical protein
MQINVYYSCNGRGNQARSIGKGQMHMISTRTVSFPNEPNPLDDVRAGDRQPILNHLYEKFRRQEVVQSIALRNTMKCYFSLFLYSIDITRR